MKLLKIIGDESEVFEALLDEAGLFSDNGGDPDGPQWLRPADDFSDDLLAAAVATGEATIVNGYEADYAAEPWNETMVQFANEQNEWCGYSADRKAYFLNESDARLSQATADRWDEDSDIETIAHRVNAF